MKFVKFVLAFAFIALTCGVICHLLFPPATALIVADAVVGGVFMAAVIDRFIRRWFPAAIESPAYQMVSLSFWPVRLLELGLACYLGLVSVGIMVVSDLAGDRFRLSVGGRIAFCVLACVLVGAAAGWLVSLATPVPLALAFGASHFATLAAGLAGLHI